MDHDGGSSLHTRSKAAPDWTVEESLILVNEVTAIEADCRDTLSSFQKWKIIVENCNALGVNRNLNHCRRKWDSLLSDYKKIKQSGSKKASFNSELFKGIERYVRDFEGGGYDTEADTDTDAPPAFVLQSGILRLGIMALYGSYSMNYTTCIKYTNCISFLHELYNTCMFVYESYTDISPTKQIRLNHRGVHGSVLAQNHNHNRDIS
ncbi:putative transcription factor MYB family [Helianthus annuus]|nr:putative transcription factor MYB family [Helianthus annuus]